ncbi:MAG: hypothetical protein ACYDEY_07665 [Acidimicrobiales bacterium]
MLGAERTILGESLTVIVTPCLRLSDGSYREGGYADHSYAGPWS